MKSVTIAVRYVTVEQVTEAHATLLEEYGGLGGGGHRGGEYEGVDAALGAVENSYYNDVYDLAAAYAVYIVQGHVFLDGNKRAASFAMLEFLHANGEEVSTPPVSLMVRLQQRSEAGEGTEALVRWVAGQLRKCRR